ncbi:hypothetical protein DL95DRAFT_392160 [Leptodontidium sp. 2 PMI_412]|nr:hypothetical protein DL95DRAFT_392160 [Leptodontidium sp. 2 PMI_412]
MTSFTSFALFCQSQDPRNTALSNPHSPTVTSVACFSLFPQLPAELRLKIWHYAIPARVLQVGTDIPYPFLRKFVSSTTESSLYPIPVTQPALFYACHDSRAVCLEEYLPFGYSYIHPTLDTLYISRLASKMLHKNLGKIHWAARPPLYPIAMVDRVAIELDESDLPPRHTWESGATASLLQNVLVAFGWFGTPKELLLVQAENTETVPSHLLTGMKSYTNLELVGIGSENIGSANKLDDLVGFVKNKLIKPRGPWPQLRVPEIKCVGMRMDGTVQTPYRELEKFFPIGDRIAAKWGREVWQLNGMDWEWGVHGNPYYPENLEKALAVYKENMKAEES